MAVFYNHQVAIEMKINKDLERYMLQGLVLPLLPEYVEYVLYIYFSPQLSSWSLPKETKLKNLWSDLCKIFPRVFLNYVHVLRINWSKIERKIILKN